MSKEIIILKFWTEDGVINCNLQDLMGLLFMIKQIIKLGDLPSDENVLIRSKKSLPLVSTISAKPLVILAASLASVMTLPGWNLKPTPSLESVQDLNFRVVHLWPLIKNGPYFFLISKPKWSTDLMKIGRTFFLENFKPFGLHISNSK